MKKIIVMVMCYIVLLALCGSVTSVIINAVFAPELLTFIFGKPTLDIFSAIGLMLICNILFKTTSVNAFSK